MPEPALTASQRAMVEMSERHTAAEFSTRSVAATMATITAEPIVNHVPVMTGSVGQAAVREFYGTVFIPAQPPDVEIVPRTRTIGQDRIVDELIYQLTPHHRDALAAPGRPPDGWRVER
jgi:carboxymethylenebutenolidase